MEVDEQVKHTFVLTKYQNVSKSIMEKGKQKTYGLYLYEDYMLIKDENQSSIVDQIYYSDLTFLHLFEPQKKIKKELIFVVQEKGMQKSTISFRLQGNQKPNTGKTIYDFVNQHIQLAAKTANVSQTLYLKQQLIQKIKNQQRNIYPEIYQSHKKLFLSSWLDSFLFEDHEEIKEYYIKARMRASQKQRKLILEKAKYKSQRLGSMESEYNSWVKNLDFGKVDEGQRFADDFRGLKFVLKDQDKEDDIVAEQLPEIKKVQIFDTFDQVRIDTDEMDIEDRQPQEILLQNDRVFQRGLRIPRAQKDKFKLFQHRGLEFEGGPSSVKQKHDFGHFNEEIAKKAKIWMQIFYKVISHRQLTIAHIQAITQELNKLLNRQPRIPAYLQKTINKNLSNMLAWKRDEGSKLKD